MEFEGELREKLLLYENINIWQISFAFSFLLNVEIFVSLLDVKKYSF